MCDNREPSGRGAVSRNAPLCRVPCPKLRAAKCVTARIPRTPNIVVDRLLISCLPACLLAIATSNLALAPRTYLCWLQSAALLPSALPPLPRCLTSARAAPRQQRARPIPALISLSSCQLPAARCPSPHTPACPPARPRIARQCLCSAQTLVRRRRCRIAIYAAACHEGTTPSLAPVATTLRPPAARITH
jgi:hypothetical protein